mmetsp:Transcript_75118/g.135301  ORF Transcript_75118/g.135301 Transcript_75118/m.135301 type:complete len:260 (-) Transcript_75118:155-934(-)
MNHFQCRPSSSGQDFELPRLQMCSEGHRLHVHDGDTPADGFDHVYRTLVSTCHLYVYLVREGEVVHVEDAHSTLDARHAPRIEEVPLSDREARVQPPLLDEVSQLRQVEGLQRFALIAHVRLRPTGDSLEERIGASLICSGLFTYLALGSPSNTTISCHAFAHPFALLSLGEIPKVSCPNREKGPLGVSKSQAHGVWPPACRELCRCLCMRIRARTRVLRRQVFGTSAKISDLKGSSSDPSSMAHWRDPRPGRPAWCFG